jgi:hypothetical protein
VPSRLKRPTQSVLSLVYIEMKNIGPNLTMLGGQS